MIRPDVLRMATEVCTARQDFDERISPTEAIALLEGGDADDDCGRASLLVLIYPGLLSSEEAYRRGASDELLEAAILSEQASLEAAAGGQERN